jgi:hypothetical protein
VLVALEPLDRGELVLAWVMIVGFSVALVPAILEAPTAAPLDLPVVAGLVVVGLSYTTGLLLAYLALTVGRVSIVARSPRPRARSPRSSPSPSATHALAIVRP